MQAPVVVQDQKLTIPVFDVMMHVLLIIVGYILSKGGDMWAGRKNTRMARAKKDAEVQTEPGLREAQPGVNCLAGTIR